MRKFVAAVSISSVVRATLVLPQTSGEHIQTTA